MSLQFLARPTVRALREPCSTDGRVLYAVGDIHGRLDLLEPLLAQIREDALAAGPAARPVVIFIGDYVDRGPASRGVIEAILALRREAEFEIRALKGNHEQALLGFLEAAAAGPAWCDHGGAQTLISYGVTPPASANDEEGWIAAREAFAAALPPEHLSFLSSLGLTAVYGDYVFVHAGLRPGVPLASQTEADLLWIRKDFLEALGPFEKVVVHGHTPMEVASMGEGRIGIDTGAYATGVLTAVRLEDDGRRLMQSGAPPTVQGAIDAAPETAAVEPPQRGRLAYVMLIQSLVLLVLVGVFLFPLDVGRPGGERTVRTPAAPVTRAPHVAPAPRPVARVAAPTPPDTPAPSLGLRQEETASAPPPPPVVSPPPAAQPSGAIKTASRPKTSAAPKAKTRAARAKTRAASARPAVGTAVQIGAFSSLAQANEGWRELRGAQPGRLAGKTKAVDKVHTGGKTFYRASIVGFASHAKAASFCAALKSAGHACIVH